MNIIDGKGYISNINYYLLYIYFCLFQCALRGAMVQGARRSVSVRMGEAAMGPQGNATVHLASRANDAIKVREKIILPIYTE